MPLKNVVAVGEEKVKKGPLLPFQTKNCLYAKPSRLHVKVGRGGLGEFEDPLHPMRRLLPSVCATSTTLLPPRSPLLPSSISCLNPLLFPWSQIFSPLFLLLLGFLNPDREDQSLGVIIRRSKAYFFIQVAAGLIPQVFDSFWLYCRSLDADGGFERAFYLLGLIPFHIL